jgi:hypothetical protein
MRRALWMLPLLFVAGCASAPETRSANDKPPIARVHAGACGACHTRVEPGMRSRAELEAALSRHHKRVHLSDDEWRAMIDYLARRPEQARTAP